MKSLGIAAPLYFYFLLVLTNAQDQGGHEPDVVAGIDPATEVRMGTLLRDHEIKDFHISTNQVYIEAVNRVANAISEASLPQAKFRVRSRRMRSRFAAHCWSGCQRTNLPLIPKMNTDGWSTDHARSLTKDQWVEELRTRFMDDICREITSLAIREPGTVSS